MNHPLADDLAAVLAEGFDGEHREARTLGQLIAQRLAFHAYAANVSPDVNIAAARVIVDAMAGYDPALSTRED